MLPKEFSCPPFQVRFLPVMNHSKSKTQSGARPGGMPAPSRDQSGEIRNELMRKTKGVSVAAQMEAAGQGRMDGDRKDLSGRHDFDPRKPPRRQGQDDRCGTHGGGTRGGCAGRKAGALFSVPRQRAKPVAPSRKGDPRVPGACAEPADRNPEPGKRADRQISSSPDRRIDGSSTRQIVN